MPENRELMRWMTPQERDLYQSYIAQAEAARRWPGLSWTEVRSTPASRRRTARPSVRRFIPYLIKRDHGRCQIMTCLFADRRIRDSKGPGGPSADHIIPWSLWRPEDGPDPDCLENLQLAHLRCNIAKGNRSTGQILLVG